MRAIVNDATDSGVDAIVEEIVADLQDAETQGIRYLPARDLYRGRYNDRFRKALRHAERAGRVTSRRAKVRPHKSQRYVALPRYAQFLPGGAR